MAKGYRGNRTTWNGFGQNSRHGPVASQRDMREETTVVIEQDKRLMETLRMMLDSLPATIETRALAEHMARSINATTIYATVSEISGWLAHVAPAMLEAQRDPARAFINQHGTVSVPWTWRGSAYKPLEHADMSLEEVGRLADCKTCGGTFLAVDIVNGKCTDCEDWSVAKED